MFWDLVYIFGPSFLKILGAVILLAAALIVFAFINIEPKFWIFFLFGLAFHHWPAISKWWLKINVFEVGLLLWNVTQHSTHHHSTHPSTKSSIRDCNLDWKSQLHDSSRPLQESQYLDDKMYVCRLGVKVRNTKMDLNIHGTWRRVTFEKLMMKIYDFFYSAKSFSHPI